MDKVYKTMDLFADISGIQLGFETHGCENVFSSEWDKYTPMMFGIIVKRIKYYDGI